MIRIASLSYDHARMHGPRSRMTGSASPRIEWAAVSSRNGDKQTAYRLIAGEWDSGWVESGDNFAYIPAGTLKKGVSASIGVQIRTAAGDESARYCDTVCDARLDNWDAEWITDPAATRSRPIYLRRKFDLPAEPTAVRLYVCGLGYHDVKFNGVPVDGSRLEPAHTDYSKRVQYVLHTGSSLGLKMGENEMTVMLGSGWRDNECAHIIDWLGGRSFSFEGPLQLSAILEADMADGTCIRLTTDDDWEAGEGPITYSNLFVGEHYDARITPAYTRRAVKTPAPGGIYEPMLIPPIVAKAKHAPVAAWADGDDNMVLDFGRNIAGVVEFSLPEGMEAGHAIRITHSEELTEDGRLFRDTLRHADAEDEYIFSGSEQEGDVWSPLFTYHGFRYARVEGIGLPYADRLRAVELRTDVDAKSSFICGDPLITKIHDIAVSTERANIHSILTDCPQRDERLGWMNDATVRFEETPYNFDVGALFPKVVRDIIDAQGDDGAITCTAPFVGGSRPADPVCSSFLVAGLEAAMKTGNMDIIREAYPAFRAWEDCLLAHSDDHIVNYSYYGDWAGPADCCVPGDGVNPGAKSAVTPGIFMSTGYSYYNCILLAKFARWLGDAEAEAQHTATAEKICNAMLDKWYDAETGIFATGSQACLAFALWLGIAPDAALTAKRLHEAVENAGWRLTTGNLCSRYIMDALSDNGYVNDAMRLMKRDEYPSIGYMIQQEATTVWERFELMKAPGMNSHDHPMYGAVDYWMYAYLAGVKCTAPGWKKFAVKPYMPDGLMSTQTVIETPLGDISVRWTKRYGAKHLQLNVPFGAEADIDFCGVKKTVGSGFHTISVDD